MSAPATAYTPPVDQPPPQPNETPYGGFWLRLAAHFVDGFLIGMLSLLVMIVWAIALGVQRALETQTLLMILVLVLSQVYHAYFVSSAKMATPGKRLCGLYVTDTDGHRLGFIHALGRNVAALLSYLTLYIGFMMAGFTERKQALHDKLAGTLVHRQPGGSAVAAIVIIVILFVSVPVIGIVAAVALPAWQDYAVRAKMSGVIAAMSTAKTPIDEYAIAKGAWPATWEQVQLNPMNDLQQTSRQYVEDIRLEKDGVIVAIVKIQNTPGQILLVPKMAEGKVEWACASSPEIKKYMPAACR